MRKRDSVAVGETEPVGPGKLGRWGDGRSTLQYITRVVFSYPFDRF